MGECAAECVVRKVFTPTETQHAYAQSVHCQVLHTDVADTVTLVELQRRQVRTVVGQRLEAQVCDGAAAAYAQLAQVGEPFGHNEKGDVGGEAGAREVQPFEHSAPHGDGGDPQVGHAVAHRQVQSLELCAETTNIQKVPVSDLGAERELEGAEAADAPRDFEQASGRDACTPCQVELAQIGADLCDCFHSRVAHVGGAVDALPPGFGGHPQAGQFVHVHFDTTLQARVVQVRLQYTVPCRGGQDHGVQHVLLARLA